MSLTGEQKPSRITIEKTRSNKSCVPVPLTKSFLDGCDWLWLGKIPAGRLVRVPSLLSINRWVQLSDYSIIVIPARFLVVVPLSIFQLSNVSDNWLLTVPSTLVPTLYSTFYAFNISYPLYTIHLYTVLCIVGRCSRYSVRSPPFYSRVLDLYLKTTWTVFLLIGYLFNDYL